MTTLVRSGRPHDDLDDLRSRISELEAALAQRDLQVTRLKADLGAFRITYRQRVGRLHEELDDLEQAITDAELGVLSERVNSAAHAPTDSGADAIRATPARSLTSDAVRTLFRDVARTIHPDFAQDDEARQRRHKLMIEANRAYAQGDEERLRWILDVWANSPDAVTGSDLDAMRLRLTRRIAQVEEQLALCAGELAEMKESSLWKLKAMVDEEAARGKDLIADMIRRLNRDILAARNRLDAMRPRQ